MKSYNSRSDAGKNVDGYDSIDDLLKDSEDESDAKSIRESPPKPKNLKDLSEKSGILGYTAPTSLECEQIFAKPIIKMTLKNPFKCSSCPFQFTARNALKDHENTDHFLFFKSDKMKHKQGKDKKDQLHKRMENKRDFEKRVKGRSEKSQRQEEKRRSWEDENKRDFEKRVKGRSEKSQRKEEKQRSWEKFISRKMTRAGKEENKREHERVVKGRR